MSRTAALWDEWADEDLLPAPSATSAGGTPATWLWPDEDLGVKVEIAWGADPSADPATWTFVDYTSRLLKDQPLSIRRGRGDGQATLQSGTCSFLLQNLDSELTPTRRSSSLWPNVRRTAPVRISLTNVGPNPPYIRFTGFVSAITPKIVPGQGGYNLSTVLIQAAGVTRRLSQGAVANSPLKRSILAADPVAYWPLEDGTDVSQFASGLARGTALGLSSGASVLAGEDALADGTGSVAQWTSTVAYGSITNPGGATVVLPSGSGTAWSMTVSFRATNPHGANVCWALAVATLPTISPGIYTYIEAYSDTGGSGIKFEYASTDLQSSTVNVFDGEAHEVTAVVTPSNTTTLSLYVDGTLVATSTAAQVLAFPDRLWVAAQPFAVTPALNTPSNVDSTVSVGHLAYFNTVAGPFYRGLVAYVGEQAHERVARIAAEEDIPAAVRGSKRSKTMGPQPTATAMDILRECEQTDRGILFETRDGFGIGYLAHTERHNRPIAMTVDLSTYRTGDSSDNVLAPLYDDQRLRNQWSISRPNGATKTASDPSSIAADGLYDDSDNANVQTDDQAEHVAAWRVFEGIVNELRYPTPPVDLAANPTDLLPAWLAIDVGDVIREVNPPAEHAVAEILHTLQGYGETLNPRSWSAAAAVSPASPWQRLHVVASQDGNFGRVDSDNSTLSSGATSGATTLSVAVTGTLWRTGACSFDIEVGPERMTVTNISGGSSPQTFTVVRSVNGITNAPAAGATVRLWNPGVVGL